jgi:transposase
MILAEKQAVNGMVFSLGVNLMRGADFQQTALFSYLSPDDYVPTDHPLRTIKALVEPMLRELSPRFDRLYAASGRPSIPPEQLLRALLLQVLYTIRSERQLMEQLQYNILFRWFVGLSLDAPVWVPTVFTKNRERLLETDHIAEAFFQLVLHEAHGRGLLSSDHFTVDGTLLEAWASHKSFQRRDDHEPPPSDDDPSNPSVHFRQERRSNATHRSVTDPDCRLAKKSAGQRATLAYLGSVITENRHGFVVNTHVTQPGWSAECDAAVEMVTTLPRRSARITLGADKGYDRPELVAALRTMGVTPHVAQNIHPRHPTSAIDGRTTRHAGYVISQVRRKRVEEVFGWKKTAGLLRKLRHRGTALVGWVFTFTNAVYNLVRLRTLILVSVCP